MTYIVVLGFNFVTTTHKSPGASDLTFRACKMTVKRGFYILVLHLNISFTYFKIMVSGEHLFDQGLTIGASTLTPELTFGLP